MCKRPIFDVVGSARDELFLRAGGHGTGLNSRGHFGVEYGVEYGVKDRWSSS